jgi:hypothetical protein
MKKLMLTTVLVAGSAFAAHAQDAFRSTADASMISASNFIGMRVYAAEKGADATEYAGIQDGWDDIGEINDVILTRDGKVDSVLVDVGGFLGMGERQVAVGMEAIKFVSDSKTTDDPNDYFLVMAGNRALIEGAPAYETTSMKATAPATDTTAAATDTTMAPADTTMAPADTTTAADATAAPAQDSAMAEATTTAPADPMMAPEGYSLVDAGKLTTEELTGAKVYGPNDKSVGEISNFVLTDSKAIDKVIVDVGGFLGMGEKPVALSMSEIKIMKEADGNELKVMVGMTEDQLKALPKAEM